MIRADETALMCDFAETYHVYDYRRLPLTMAASLACGLRDNSRIKMIMSGTKTTPEIMLLSAILDRLSWLVWSKTKDGQKNRNKPGSILNALTKPQDSDIVGFSSGKDFEVMRQKLLEGR